MYISKIHIKNYRTYDDLEIKFNDKINIIIGHNNAGKSNLIKAISLFFDSNTKKNLDINDFNKNISLQELKTKPPKIFIELTIKESDKENLMADDLVTVSNWLIKLEEPYEAKLTYEYFLDSKLDSKYIDKVKDLEEKEEIWNIIEEDFIRFYNYKIWGGNIENRIVAESESLQKFDFQFLNAVRDVERDMFTGKNTMLKKVLDFFMDYEIKSNEKLTEEEKESKIRAKKVEFSKEANDVLDRLKQRVEKGKEQVLSYSNEIGASFDKSYPNFDGKMSEEEFYSTLKLIVEYETGMKIPISNNGLGYNNLIFMSLLLAKMQIDSDGKYLGSNAKIFPILAIEEPEAHLHPSMQFQFLKFLNRNLSDNRVRQIFITTHSTHIVSSAGLDQIICLYRNEDKVNVAYPGQVFENNKEGLKNKNYVQRFLDATKSDMLFADRVILVEGLAEQLLLSIFAEYMGFLLEEKHIAVISVGGRYFDHFLKLFDFKNNKNALYRKIACITDIDPTRKSKNSRDGKLKKIYPYEYNMELEEYDYKKNTKLKQEYDELDSNIRIFTQDDKTGKTFEYDLVLHNPTLELLITDSIKNKKELNNLMKALYEDKSVKEIEDLLGNIKENDRIKDSINKANHEWDDEMKKRAIIASRYLNSVGKGENALELSYVLQENLKSKGQDNYKEFVVPKYIEDAIKWVCE